MGSLAMPDRPSVHILFGKRTVMKKTVSLKDNRTFRSLYRAKCSVSPEFILYYKKNRLENNRLGITVGKKIGHAFERNRSKRVIREAYRMCEDGLKNGYDFVFVARTKTKTLPMQAVMSRMKEVFEKEDLIVKTEE